MFFLQNVFPFPLEDVFPFSWTCEKPVLWSYPTENKNVVSFFSRTCEKSVWKISRPLNIKKSCFFLEREKSQYGEYISSWKQVSPNTSQLLSCKSWGNWSFNRGDNIFRIKCRESRLKQFFWYQMSKNDFKIINFLSNVSSQISCQDISQKLDPWMNKDNMWLKLYHQIYVASYMTYIIHIVA